MSDVNVKLSIKGVNALMRSKPVQAEVNKRAAKMAAAAGPKYRMVVSPHKWTARAFVSAADGAKITDADVSGLARAIDAARG